jgi:hypothetical protein
MTNDRCGRKSCDGRDAAVSPRTGRDIRILSVRRRAPRSRAHAPCPGSLRGQDVRYALPRGCSSNACLASSTTSISCDSSPPGTFLNTFEPDTFRSRVQSKWRADDLGLNVFKVHPSKGTFQDSRCSETKRRWLTWDWGCQLCATPNDRDRNRKEPVRLRVGVQRYHAVAALCHCSRVVSLNATGSTSGQLRLTNLVSSAAPCRPMFF